MEPGKVKAVSETLPCIYIQRARKGYDHEKDKEWKIIAWLFHELHQQCKSGGTLVIAVALALDEGAGKFLTQSVPLILHCYLPCWPLYISNYTFPMHSQWYDILQHCGM